MSQEVFEWKDVNVGRLRTTNKRQARSILVAFRAGPLDRLGGQGTWPARFCFAPLGWRLRWGPGREPTAGDAAAPQTAGPGAWPSADPHAAEIRRLQRERNEAAAHGGAIF